MIKRKRLFSIVLVLMVAVAIVGCDRQPAQSESIEVNAVRLIETLQDGRYDDAYHTFVYERRMRNRINAKAFENLYEDVLETYGAPVRVVEYETNIRVQGTTVSVIVEHEQAQLIFNVVYDADQRISGFEYGRMHEEVRSVESDEHSDPIEQPHVQKSVTFGTEEYPLRGVLSLPENGQAPYPLVILVAGSGPLDMDLRMGPNKPFADIARLLNDQGIAVFRYNNRAYEHFDRIGENIDTFTPYQEIIEDAVAAFTHAKTFDAIDASRIVIAGHSIGGFFIPKIASKTNDAAGYIMLAANSYNLEDLIYEQYKTIMMLDGRLSLAERFVLARYRGMTRRVRDLQEGATTSARRLYGVPPAYWLYANDYDQLAMVKKIDHPILFLQGDRDYQVNLHNFQIWQDTMENKSNATFILYENLNHLFIYGERASRPAEYDVAGEVYNALGDDIAQWLFEHIS